MTFTRNDTKVIKGIAIILMLYHHLFYFPDRIAAHLSYIPLVSYHGASSAYLLGEFGKLCVALFLFLGGYGTFLSYRKQVDNGGDSAPVILSKIKHLYVEYWKVFVIFIPLCLLMGVAGVVPGVRTMLWNLTGMNITYCGEWWFFTPYVALLFTYPIGQRLMCGHKTVFHDVFAVLLTSVFTTYVLPVIGTYPWAERLNGSLMWSILNLLLTYVPTFYMGCVFAKYDLLSAAKRRFAPGLKTAIGAIAVLLAAVALRHNEGTTYDFLLAPLVTVAATVLLGGRVFAIVRRVLEIIGRESTTIWLVHSMYCYLLLQNVVFLPRYTVLICLWLLALSFATSVAIRHLFRLLAAVFNRKKSTEKE